MRIRSLVATLAVAAAGLTGPGGIGVARADITKGPYLQLPGPTHMTICWEGLHREPGRVLYGTRGKLDRRTADLTPTRVSIQADSRAGTAAQPTEFYVYEAVLSGLKPGVTYEYQVECGTHRSARHEFTTFSPKSRSTRFLIYGDSRSGPTNHARLASLFLPEKPSFILHSGDLVGSDSFRHWGPEYFDPMRQVIPRVPVMPSIGNHEGRASNYLAYFHLPDPERYYAFENGPVFVLNLDDRKKALGDEQYEFARRSLAATRASWRVVQLHSPMFNLGGHRSAWDGQEIYLPLFRQYRVDLVVAGHSHIYERFHPLVPRAETNAWAILHITSGGGGAPLYATQPHSTLVRTAREHHFVAAEATRSTLHVRAINIDGRPIDEFKIRKVRGGQSPEFRTAVRTEEEVQEARAQFRARDEAEKAAGKK